MKYSKMMERATLYYARISKRGLNEIRQVESTLSQLRADLADIRAEIEGIAGQQGLLEDLREIDKRISENAQATYDAKRCSKGGKALRAANRASRGKVKTKEEYLRMLSILETEKMHLMVKRAEIKEAVNAEANRTGLLKKEHALKNRISSVTRTLNRAKKRGFVTSPPKKKKRRSRSVRTVSGGGVNPR